MITIGDYIKLIEFNADVVKNQTSGLLMPEMLVQPKNGGNCMLWILGHLTNNLRIILRIVGGDDLADLPDLSQFARGSEPIKELERGLLTSEQLLNTYNQLNAAVIAQLKRVDEAYFDEDFELFPGSVARRGWWAYFFSFHHAYHVGQLEQLRNLAGHIEKLL